MSSQAQLSPAARLSELRAAHQRVQRTHLDYLFTGFLQYEWLLALAVTIWLSRENGISVFFTLRQQLVTLFLGALLAIVPALVVWQAPGRRVSRCVIAIAQMLFSGYLMHLTEWRIGVHFHIFASLLFLAYYVDPWVMVAALGTAIPDQFLRGWPALSGNLFLHDSRWRTTEHAGWVLFGALFVLDARREAIRAFRRQADRETELESDLLLAQKQAGRDVSDRTDLLAAAGRALRAPVESVLGMVTFLLDSVLNPTQEKVARSIQGSGELLLATVNDILDLSQVDAGQAHPDPVPCNLQVAVSQAVDWMDYAARQKNLHLWVKYPPQCPRRFVADRARIRQVLLNLLSNAVRYTEYGSITVAVEAVGTFGDETTVRITVTDTGIGMSEGQMERIFELFDPRHSSDKRSSGSTGLGLSLSKRLVGLLGGEMGASSKPGLGSQFWFTMHLKRDAQRVDARHAELADLRILVVDHVPANRQIAAEVLSQWGCRAECASSALAVERMSEAQRSGDPFRMLIAGQRMAEQEAESLAQTVKADPQLRDTVLVMVAANPTPQGCRDSLKAGFTEYIERPSGISDIYKGMVRAWLESQHPSPPAAAILKSPDRSDPTRLSILVVDDNAEDRAALARTLEEFGGQAETAASGQQALEMWGARSYNLILMDCDMPDLDGYETTTEIRGLEQLMSRDPNRPSRTPIVAMLEGSVGVSRVKCVARGMDGGLTKPLSRGTIESLLQRFAPALALAEKSNRR